MSLLRVGTEVSAERLSFLLVSSANHRSMRCSQLLAVGVKCSLKRGWASSQRLILRGLVGRGVVEDQVDIELGGDLLVECLQELLELDRAVAGVEFADHLARDDVLRRVQAGGPVPLVVVGRALWRAGKHRQDRPGAIQRLDLGLLVDRQDHRPLGRVQVQADDVTPSRRTADHRRASTSPADAA
jgi:hypothetical protein